MIVAFDLETYPIAEGMPAPKLVCGSFKHEVDPPALHEAAGTLKRFRWELECKRTLVGHNVVFDLAVLCAEDPSLLPLVFDAFEEGRIKCTMVRERMLNNALGELTYDRRGKKQSYSLAAIVLRRFGEVLPKEDATRKGFYRFAGIPVEQWPEEDRAYVLRDSAEALRLFQSQEDPEDEDRQHRAAFWLALTALWGLRTDAEAVRRLKRRLERRIEKLSRFFIGSEFVRTDGTKDIKAIRAAVERLVPGVGRTPTGQPETSAEVLEATGLVPLRALASVARAQKLLSTYVPVLEGGTTRPICTRYTSFLETGRTASSSPNVQNLPAFPGVRECYVPREGFVYVDIDYSTLELRALAQSCLERFGFSRMAEAIRAGRDLHTSFAATLLKCSYEEACKRVETTDEGKHARKLAKAFNFGIPGGLGADTFLEFAWAMYGIRLTKAQFYAFKKEYFRTFPEVGKHLEWAGALTANGPATVGPPYLAIKRGGLSYSKLANIVFQERAARGAKDAGWLLTRACYDPRSPLYGSRVVAFIHDEFLLEVPRLRVSAAVPEIERLTVAGMVGVIPDIPIEAKAKVMERWEK